MIAHSHGVKPQVTETRGFPVCWYFPPGARVDRFDGILVVIPYWGGVVYRQKRLFFWGGGTQHPFLTLGWQLGQPTLIIRGSTWTPPPPLVKRWTWILTLQYMHGLSSHIRYAWQPLQLFFFSAQWTRSFDSVSSCHRRALCSTFLAIYSTLAVSWKA